jgi:NitT/TauT family transport system permease protein
MATQDQSRFAASPIPWQIGIGIALLLVWQLLGYGSAGEWISRPSLVAMKLISWSGNGLFEHIGITLAELICGLLPGVACGVLAGLVLGRAPVMGVILRPVVVAFYSIPLISLAPLFIMFFGIGMLPKVVLVAVVVFFLLFFNTYAGVEQVDHDVLASVQLMGARREEEFRKVILPASIVWIINGVKIAVPYALVATITGELVASQSGLGFLLNKAAEQFDMTSLYAVLFVLMLLGLALSEVSTRIERHLLRWRHATI